MLKPGLFDAHGPMFLPLPVNFFNNNISAVIGHLPGPTTKHAAIKMVEIFFHYYKYLILKLLHKSTYYPVKPMSKTAIFNILVK